MLPTDYKEKGCILFVTINDLITYIARDYPLKNFEVIVISKSIITESRGKEERSFGNLAVDESKYDNVDFVPILIPTTSTLSLLYAGRMGGGGYEEFSSAYLLQLNENEAFTELVCIVDMAFSEHIPILIVAVDIDFNMGYPDLLMEHINQSFNYHCHGISEFLDPSFDVCEVGDRVRIQEALDDYKAQLSQMNDKNAFFNYMVESARVKYKELLEMKTMDQLVLIATDAGVFLRKRDKKEDIIRKIIERKVKKR